MTIWTIYNHGTGGSSYKGPDKAEIVNLFGNNDRRPEFRGKIITEGVGSIGDPHNIANEFARDAQSGVYSVAKIQDGTSGFVGRGARQATGGGVQDNVDNTVEFVRALNLAGQKPAGINMMGWSRGAVTCIRIAWTLYQSQDANLRNIPINIFGVDPVAGAGHSTETDATTVTPNVKNYFATLALGETRRFFKPIAGHRLHVVDPAETKCWVIPMPGNHSDLAKMDNNSGRMVFNLAYRFLAGCQTAVPAMRHYMLSNLAAWKLYEEVIVGEAEVHKTGKLSQFFLGGVGYKRTTEASAHNFGEAFFPNVHARKVFSRAYPVTYDAYFSPANISRRNTLAWGTQFSPRIVAEQKQNAMSQAMMDRLQSLQPGDANAGGPVVPPSVDLMAGQLGLVD